MLIIQISVVLFVVSSSVYGQENWKTAKNEWLQRAPEGPPSPSILDRFGAVMEDLPNFQYLLQNILIQRAPGTEGNKIVRNFIVDKMKELDWDVETDSFTELNTVVGQMEFHNIVATHNPDAPRTLVLACHYDSKVTPDGFLGATDSAVPCSQMINLAYTMKRELNNSREAGHNVTLQLIFFDGEEAFRSWTATDSIYGARHLAEKWEGQTFTSNHVDGNYLNRIDIFVLLDLLGAKDPVIFSTHQSTQKWYSRLSAIEDALVNSSAVIPGKIFPGFNHIPVEDDHIPFLNRGVNILHLIATPFPDVWHTLSDNYSAVDMDTVKKLNTIFRIFVAEYLQLV